MIFKCKNNCEVYYNIKSFNDNNAKYDFFLSDVNNLVKTTNPEIKDIIYIIGIHVDEESENVKDMIVYTINEFINKHKDEFIIFRTGFNDDNTLVDDDKIKKSKDRAIEDYVAAIEAGFVNVNSYTGLEYSQTFVYKNDKSKKFLNAIARYEALTWAYNCDFDFNEIYK